MSRALDPIRQRATEPGRLKAKVIAHEPLAGVRGTRIRGPQVFC